MGAARVADISGCRKRLQTARKFATRMAFPNLSSLALRKIENDTSALAELSILSLQDNTGPKFADPSQRPAPYQRPPPASPAPAEPPPPDRTPHEVIAEFREKFGTAVVQLESAWSTLTRYEPDQRVRVGIGLQPNGAALLEEREALINNFFDESPPRDLDLSSEFLYANKVKQYEEVIKAKADAHKAANRAKKDGKSYDEAALLSSEQKASVSSLYRKYDSAKGKAQVQNMLENSMKLKPLYDSAWALHQLMQRSNRFPDPDMQWAQAVRMFASGGDNVLHETRNSAFDVYCQAWVVGARIWGVRWLQDPQFHRLVLALARERGAKVPNITTSISPDWALSMIFRIDPLDPEKAEKKLQAGGGRTLRFLLAIDIASRRVREWMGKSAVADAPKPDEPAAGIVGWDVDLDLPHNAWARSGLLRMSSSTAGPMLSILPGPFATPETRKLQFAFVTARRLLAKKHSRQLGVVLSPDTAGTSGREGRAVRSNVIEFGLSGQYCSVMERVLKYALMLFPEGLKFMSPLVLDVTGDRNRDAVLEFKASNAKVALITWASHARAIIKMDYAPHHAIVDPWKPAERVRPPKVVSDVFEGTAEWVEREPEQFGEGSCFLVSCARAFAVALEAAAGGGTAEMLAVARQGPREGRSPVCAAVALLCHTLTTGGKYPKMEVFRQPAPALSARNLKRQATLLSPAPEPTGIGTDNF